MQPDPRAREVVEFWFGTEVIPSAEIERRWWLKDPVFDAEIGVRFGGVMEAAARGALDDWLTDAITGLALVIVLDQFPRNVYRGTPGAFVTDPKALTSIRTLIAAALDRELTPHQRMVAYLPYEHSEDAAVQAEGIALFERLAAEVIGADERVVKPVASALDFARKHADLIIRFGRFPHRNAILGRPSTPEELAYLATPGAGF